MKIEIHRYIEAFDFLNFLGHVFSFWWSKHLRSTGRNRMSRTGSHRHRTRRSMRFVRLCRQTRPRSGILRMASCQPACLPRAAFDAHGDIVFAGGAVIVIIAVFKFHNPRLHPQAWVGRPGGLVGFDHPDLSLHHRSNLLLRSQIMPSAFAICRSKSHLLLRFSFLLSAISLTPLLIRGSLFYQHSRASDVPSGKYRIN